MVITRPALTIFLRSISSPIMNSSKLKPMPEMVSMESGLVTHLNPCGPMANPATRYASNNGCLVTCEITATTHAAMMQSAISMTKLCSTARDV